MSLTLPSRSFAQKKMQDMGVQYRREQQLMASAWNDPGRKALRESSNNSRVQPSYSWLGQSRKGMGAQLGMRA